ncbi:MAG: hypothetical protein V1875_07200 [Candidatus Altiarchaeota archaeon]
MRIAIHDKDRCKPKDCNFLCMRMCPVNRTGGECITESPETKKPVISEALCQPFKAGEGGTFASLSPSAGVR